MSVAEDDENAKRLGDELRVELEKVLAERGVPTTDAEVEAIAEEVYPRVARSRGQHYDSQVRIIGSDMAEMGLEVSPAKQRPYNRGAVDKAVRRAAGLSEPARPGEVSNLDPDTRAMVKNQKVPIADPKNPAMIAMFRKKLSESLVRHARQAGRNAVADTAKKGRVREIGSKRPVRGARWARVLTGAENCPFCMMLASRGPDYTSEDTASGQWHDHCDCIARMVIPGQPWEGQEEYERLRQMWDEAPGHGEEKKKAFNREVDRRSRMQEAELFVPESLRGTGELPGVRVRMPKNPDGSLMTHAAYFDGEPLPRVSELSKHSVWGWNHGEPRIDSEVTPRNGHSHDSARPGSSYFPKTWTDQDISNAISDTVETPDKYSASKSDRFVYKEVNGVGVEVQWVVKDGNAAAFSAYPIYGSGVERASKNGRIPWETDRGRMVERRYGDN